jgi:AcrR family transcriptional regulator
MRQQEDTRTTKSGERRARIVAAAGRVIARDGVAAATTRTIAGEAGVNLATLHSLFGSKDALLAAVLEQVTDLTIAALARPMLVPRGRPTALAETATLIWALAAREPWLPLARCELLLYLRRRAGHQQEARAQQRRYLRALAERCRRPRATTEGRAACGTLAELLASTVDGLALYGVFADTTRTRTRLRNQALRAVLALVEGEAPPRGRTGGTGGRPQGDAVRRRGPTTRGAPSPVGT